MEVLKVYFGYNTNQKIRLSSSSGGIFTALAENVLCQEGIVFGVAMSDDCYSAEYIRVTDKNSLPRLRGSKYLQAKVGDTFKLVKNDLLSGKVVLFTGTGCQVNGLRCFLGRDFENLICVDVICHGAPSPTLWKKYAEYQEERNNGKLCHINFRCKDDGWNDFRVQEVLNDVTQNKEKRVYISKDKDPYMQMFLKNYSLRPSCYSCMVKSKKLSDLTIADFWGIEKIAPEMNDGKGSSLVLIRTKKGQNFFSGISHDMRLYEVSYEEGVASNPAEYKSCERPPQRSDFFLDMHSMSFEDLASKYITSNKGSIKNRIKRRIKQSIKQLLLEIGGKGIKANNSKYGLLFVFGEDTVE